MCLRYVTENLEVMETCIGLYQASSTTAEAFFEMVQDALARTQLKIENVRGQCCDGAANMAGAISGLQTRVKAEEPRAVFIHCTAHRLNLVIRDVLDGVREVRDVIQEVSRLVTFFRDSPKRLEIFQNTGGQATLRPLCPTRWTCGEGCLNSLLSGYAQTMTSLEEINQPDVASAASGFARTMQRFEFFFGLKLALLLLGAVTPVMLPVQGSSQSVAANVSMVKTLRLVIVSQRDTFPRFWAEVTDSAEKLGLDKPRVGRQRWPPRQVDDGAEPHIPPTPEDNCRRVYVEAVDWMAGAMAGRFPSDETTLAIAERALVTAEEKALQDTAAFYGLDAERLRLHARMLGDVAKQRGSRLTDMGDVSTLLRDAGLQHILTEATDLLRIIMTAPATPVPQSEPSASCVASRRGFAPLSARSA